MESIRNTLIVAVAACAGWSVSVAVAQERAPLYPKADVDAIVATKKLAYVRDSDQKKIEYELRDGRSFYSLATSGGRNLTLSGSYEVTDDGHLCFKWQPDRYVTLPDACYVFRHDGEKVVIAGARNPSGKIGELVP